MTITELGMHYYLLLDVFLLGVFMLRKAVNPLSLRRPSLLTLNRNVDSDFTVPVVSKGGLMLVLMVVNLNFGLLFLPSAVVAFQSQFRDNSKGSHLGKAE